MKMINTILILVLTISPLCAEVVCNLHFTDENQAGFNKQGNEWMIKEAQEAATLIGKLIKQDACINIRVNSTNDTPYAWAPTEHFNVVNEKFGNRGDHWPSFYSQTPSQIQFSQCRFYGDGRAF